VTPHTAKPLEQIGNDFSVPPPGPLPPMLGRQIALILQAGVRKRFQTATDPFGRPWPALRRPRPQGGSQPLLNTGVLRNSYQPRVEADGASIASVLPQARLQNFGGIIVPTRAKALSIPLTVEAVRAGSPRRFPRRLQNRPVRGGRNVVGVLYERDRQGRVREHYLLVKKITVPARWHLGAGPEELRQIDLLAAEYGYRLAAAPTSAVEPYRG